MLPSLKTGNVSALTECFEQEGELFHRSELPSGEVVRDHGRSRSMCGKDDRQSGFDHGETAKDDHTQNELAEEPSRHQLARPLPDPHAEQDRDRAHRREGRILPTDSAGTAQRERQRDRGERNVEARILHKPAAVEAARQQIEKHDRTRLTGQPAENSATGTNRSGQLSFGASSIRAATPISAVPTTAFRMSGLRLVRRYTPPMSPAAVPARTGPS